MAEAIGEGPKQNKTLYIQYFAKLNGLYKATVAAIKDWIWEQEGCIGERPNAQDYGQGDPPKD